MTQVTKRRLGRGLAALIGDDVTEEGVVEDARSLRHVPIEFLRGSPNNPRKNFKEQDLDELARSIREKGLLQPLVVRAGKEEPHTYEIVAGERRWRAAQRAGIHEVPVLIRELSDGEMLEIALIENIQRSDLNPIEEASGYAQLTEQFDYTQQQLAESLGKSRSHIANMLRLLNLPESVREKVETGALSAGHARTLVATQDPEALAEKMISLGLSVRQAEDLIKTPAASKKVGNAKASKPEQKTADVRALEKELREAMGLVVEISSGQGEKGALTIHYKTLEQLEEVCLKLKP
ncbi:Chromosome (plasmid) partitioning protein ParB [hydrothermal vent metagenome]|uniref:Chromosome (Plasmid) partitioning protein ParB n=1 Tax=hydrothermal vent metagenome TaxID=652676 RepID=A0A3B0RFH0_9ZZZZ